MDCCDWLWFIESLDDSGMPVITQPAPPRHVKDPERIAIRSALSRHHTSLSTWRHLGRALFGASRRGSIAQDAQSHTDHGVVHYSESHQTKAA